VALMIALILVALATILATKLTFDGFLERRRAIGVMAAEQALHFGMGAEALAADALSQDLQMSASQTTLTAAWAQPTQPLPITPRMIQKESPLNPARPSRGHAGPLQLEQLGPGHSGQRTRRKWHWSRWSIDRRSFRGRFNHNRQHK